MHLLMVWQHFFHKPRFSRYSEQILIEKLIRNSSAIHSHKNVTTW
jgi:hypothetical protein